MIQTTVLSMGTTAIDHLESALSFWEEQYNSIFSLLTTTPDEFQGGVIWNMVSNILNILQATGASLLIIFFLYGLVKAGIDYRDVFNNPQNVLKAFIRIGIAQFFVVHTMDVLMTVLRVVQEMITKIYTNIPALSYSIPDDLRAALESADWWAGVGAFAVSLLAQVIIGALSIIVVVVVYGRFFKIFLLTAIAPIPLAGFASEATSTLGQNFMKSYIGECMRGVIIIVACIIFSAFASSPTSLDPASPGAMTFWYVAEVAMQLLLLVIITKGSDRLVKELFGL